MKKLKEELIDIIEDYRAACSGAMMCSDTGKPLYEFASNMSGNLLDLQATIYNDKEGGEEI